MTKQIFLTAALSLPALALASCAAADSGDRDPPAQTATEDATTTQVSYETTEYGAFDEPWAIRFAPGTGVLFITEKPGTMKFLDTGAMDGAGRMGTVTGLPDVDYGGQGGLGDIAFLESETGDLLEGRTIYLSWAEAGEGDTRGAAVGRGTLICGEADACEIEGLQTIWRQSPKVSGRGHYSHRLAISPDEKYLFIASGERQKQDPAQDTSNTLGTIVRLNLDGTPASGNPMDAAGGATAEIWSWGHRNILGLDFDAQGHLWEVEHGPKGGDELNLVQRGKNYGWPVRSFGDNYNGSPIPDHTADDGFVKPAIHWTPVIAPGDMVFYSGDMFAPWQGDLLMTGLKTEALIRVETDGDRVIEAGRYDFGNRIRSIAIGPDGAIWLAEDGKDGRILKLSR